VQIIRLSFSAAKASFQLSLEGLVEASRMDGSRDAEKASFQLSLEGLVGLEG
jgi:hypothetical protein